MHKSHARTLRALRAEAGETVRTVRTVAKLSQGRTDWFKIENNTARDETVVHIYDEIGYFGVTAQDFVSELKGANTDLTVHINSPGGDVFDGIAILNALRAHKGTVTTIVDGLAASAASFIAQAGQKRIMARNSEMMIHDASGLCIGNAKDMAEMLGLLERTSDNIASVYTERSGRGSVEEWRSAMSAETWYSAAEAVSVGLADEVDGEPAGLESFTDSWDLSIYAHASRATALAPEILPERPRGVIECPDDLTDEEVAALKARFDALSRDTKPIALQPFNLELFKKGLGHGA